MEYQYYGFDEFDTNEYFGCEANDHAMSLLVSLSQYFKAYSDKVKAHTFEYQAVEDVKLLSEVHDDLEKIIAKIYNSYGMEVE